MTKYKIVALDPIAPEGLALLDAEPNFEYEVRTGLKGDDLRKTLAEFDGAIVRSGVKITQESLAGNRRLKAIVRAGVGTDNIDKAAATRLGIIVMNTPAGNTLSTAEHTLALMLALARDVAPAYHSLLEGRWDRKSFMGTQLAGKTLGVVGMGRIGREVALRAQAFQMKVLGYDPFLTEDQAAKLGIQKAAEIREMLPQVDFLTVHTPLNNETKDLIGLPELELVKPGIRLVNCARGGIYNEEALVAGLKSGQIAGVALDVFAEEPCTSSPLFGMPGVVCTPHLGASTNEAQTQVAVEGIGLLMNFFNKGEIRQAVNMSSLDPQTLAAMQGFLDAARRLGLFLAQLQGGNVETCVLRYQGDVAALDTKPLTAAFCAGLLERALEESVNMVNSELLLRERGIELTQATSKANNSFTSIINAEVAGTGGRVTASVALFGTNMPRLVMIDELPIDAYLDGLMLIFRHSDVPGVIGRVGTIFGEHKVNIAQMSVGRDRAKPGQAAVGVLNLDSPPTSECLELLQEIPSLTSVQLIELPPEGVLPSWLII
ncbi:MAG: phosphoglycerate dehydrogenase [Pirellulaceae bacterium]|nr:phosphoglycerate dehydrogenase [Pirellulaceae bacterium]